MDGESTAVSTSISLDELEAQITELAGQLNAANYRWLMLIAEFDRRNGWSDGKLHSCAHWLNVKVGLNLGAAREKVRVAHALAGLPRIAAAMARGELSYSKVRALSRVACPATEESLLMIAQHGTAHHVERLVRGYRRAPGAAKLSPAAPQPVKRPATHGGHEDGRLPLPARPPPLAGAGGVPSAHPPPRETARRLACDASLLQVLETQSGEPLDVGRKTRSIPPAIRRALNTRDGGCRFPGCTHQRYVDAHHIQHWADGGETKLANLVTLCRLHHRLVHEGEILIEPLPGGGWRLVHPDGRHFALIRCSQAASYDGEELERAHAALGIPIDADTAATRCLGERMDYDLGVWILCNQANRAREEQDVSAETCDQEDDDSAETFDEEDDVSAKTSDQEEDVSADTA